MKHAIDEGECPGCGAKLDVQNALGVLEFLNISDKFKLPLGSKELKIIIDEYFKKLLGLDTLPEIIIEEEMSDKIRLAGQIKKQITNIKENDRDDTNLIPNKTLKNKIIKSGDSDHPPLVEDENGLIFHAGGTSVKLSPEEIEEVKKGLGVPPIAKINDPNKGDQFTDKVPGLKFIDKNQINKNLNTAINYNEFDREAEEEAERIKKELSKSSILTDEQENTQTSNFSTASGVNNILQSGHTLDLTERTITLPGVSSPTKGNIITNPDSIIVPKKGE